MIVAAAQLQGCETLLTEDLQPGMSFDGLVVQNPFLHQVQELRAVYAVDIKPVLRHRRLGRPRQVRFASVSAK